MRLNLGSGPVAAPGWTCIDRSPSITLDRVPGLKRALRRTGVINAQQAIRWDPSIVRADIRRLPYPDHSIDAIYSSHALEHIYLNEARRVLAESKRVLQPGGIIRLALPDCEAAIRALTANGVVTAAAAATYNHKLYAFPEERPGVTGLVRRAIGGDIHRWQPFPSYVSQMLTDSGFTMVRRWDFHQGELPGLTQVETRPESFFLEARA